MSLGTKFHSGKTSNDDIWSSIASSSAIVSESIVDTFPAESYRRTRHPSPPPLSEVQHNQGTGEKDFKGSSDDSNGKGINRHNYSSIQRILERQVHLDDMNDDEDDEFKQGSFVSRTTDSFFKWVQLQKRKRQKEALERAVEEQRKKIQEALGSSVTHHNTYAQKQSENFQSGLFACGSVACGDDDYFTNEFNEESRDNSSFDEYISSVQNSKSPGDSSYYDDESDRSYSHHDGFKIGKPCHTVSGQGVAVQLELLDNNDTLDENDPGFKSLDLSNDDTFSLNIEYEPNSVPFILNSDQMKAIALNGLPESMAYSKWIRLYCLQRDGDSFANSFLRKVQGVERTLLVIHTTKGEIMGGYSNSPWESQSGSVGAAFYGSCQASLFKIDKNTNNVQVFRWTAKNRYIQVCDIHASLLAFGGGGTNGSFGLCVEDDFSVGTTGRCETFDNDPLCDEEQFEILNVECWGFTASF